MQLCSLAAIELLLRNDLNNGSTAGEIDGDELKFFPNFIQGQCQGKDSCIAGQKKTKWLSNGKRASRGSPSPFGL